MDQNICRAKRKNDGKWIYGYYVAAPYEYGHGEIAHLIITRGCEYRECGEFSWMDVYEIDPRTLCRCTGVKDNNGNMIFEHDIIGHSLYGLGTKSEVVWRGSCFCAGRYTLDTFHSKRVHGSIFDNTELMEEQHV